jgi:hypothetical protein
MIAVFAALALAACGGGSSKVSATGSNPTTTTTPTGGAAGGRFDNAAFTACLKQHGVTLPAGALGFGRRGGSGGGGGRGPRGGSGGRGGGFFGGGAGGAGLSSKDQAAFTACRSKLPAGGFGGGGRAFAGGASATQIKAYMTCLSQNGVKVPTTTSTPAGGSGRRFGNPLAGLRSDPHFAAASKTCAPLLPARGTRTPTTLAAG